MKDLVGFGALNVDLFFRIGDSRGIVDALHPHNQCPHGGFIMECGSALPMEEVLQLLEAEGDLVARSGGGSAANTTYALARMGFSTSYIGRVGSDEAGEYLLSDFQAVGVDTGSIVVGPGSTGTCISMIDEEGERSLIVFPNENDRLTERDVDSGVVGQTRWLHLSSFIGEPPLLAQKSAVASLSSGVKVSIDPGEIYARRGLEDLGPLFGRSTVVFIGKDEIELLTGSGYEDGVVSLKKEMDGVICKMGRLGSEVFWGDERFLMPALECDARDTTGAGDVYAAGFIAGLLLGQPVRRCAHLGTRLACQSLTDYGRERYPDRSDLEEALDERI